MDNKSDKARLMTNIPGLVVEYVNDSDGDIDSSHEGAENRRRERAGARKGTARNCALKLL